MIKGTLGKRLKENKNDTKKRAVESCKNAVRGGQNLEAFTKVATNQRISTSTGLLQGSNGVKGFI